MPMPRCVQGDKYCSSRCPIYLREFKTCWEGLTADQKAVLQRRVDEERAELLRSGVYVGCSFVRGRLRLD